MSAPRTPTKSGNSRESGSRNSGRSANNQATTPPVGGSQPRSVTSSQRASPAVRSSTASAASLSGAHDKLNSATNKPNGTSPTPGI